MSDLASRIDHAVLHPSATADDARREADRCAAAGVRAVCVYPRAVRAAVRSGARVAAVIDFPAAGSLPEVVRREAALARDDGAEELDLVLPAAEPELSREVLDAATQARLPVKGIVEAAFFDDDALCRIAESILLPGGAAFLKTGTGVYGNAVDPARARRLRRRLPAALALKVSGGVGDAATAEALLEAGVEVIGTSRTFAILGLE